MKHFRLIRIAFIALGILGVGACSSTGAASDDIVRILSWNVSEHAHVKHPEAFRSLLAIGNADIVLLDEVSPDAGRGELQPLIAAARNDDRKDWQVLWGISGGRQRGVVASRYPLQALPEFSTPLQYSQPERAAIEARMPQTDFARKAYGMDGGIPVNGAIVTVAGRRILLVITDLQCCGEGPDSWQEYRRQLEARIIAASVRRVLAREDVFAVVIAGDFNAVAGRTPLEILSGPYGSPSATLSPAKAIHLGAAAAENWTWDGRGTPFPSGVLDFQLYDPDRFSVRTAIVLDTEDMPVDTLRRHGLDAGASRALSEHRPILVEYGFR